MKVSIFKAINERSLVTRNKVMKKLPLVFCCIFLACSSKKETVDDQIVFKSHQQPFHISAVGKWNDDYLIYTLIDARDTYFTIKTPSTTVAKRGDVYIPDLSTNH